MSGQLALAVDEQTIAPAAVWETLSVASARVTVALARLLARMVEAERDE